MNRFLTFAGKELKEMLRTKRFIVLSVVFLIFAITGPLLARYLIEFIDMMMPADDMASLVFEISEPTWNDAYSMYYTNIIQMGIFAVILMFMGTIFDEKRRGTAALMMMKGVKHHTFILAKFAVIMLVTLVVIIIATFVVHLYTYILFEQSAVLSDAMFGAMIFWLFVLFMASITIFFSSMAKSTVTSAMLSIVAFFGVIIVDLINPINTFAPYNMANRAVSITLGGYGEHLWANVSATIGLIAALLAASIYILRKQEI